MNIVPLINKLCTDTQEKKLSWALVENLEDNDALLKAIQKQHFNVNLWKQNSFYVSYKQGYIVLLSLYDDDDVDIDFYCLAVITDINSRIYELNTLSENQEELSSLNAVIKEQIFNVADFLADFLNDRNI